MKLGITEQGNILSDSATSGVRYDTTGQGNPAKNQNAPGNLDIQQNLDGASLKYPLCRTPRLLNI